MNCIFCGKPAGWFRRSHAECSAQHAIGRQQIAEHLKWYFQSDMSAELLRKGAQEISQRHFVSSAELHSLAIMAFNDAVDAIVEHQAPSRDQENKLALLQKEFALTQTETEGAAKRLMSALFKGYLHSETPVAQLAQCVREIADHYSVTAAELHRLAIACFRRVVDTALEDQLLSKEEEAKLVLLQKEFSLTQAELGGSIEQVTKVAILRDVDAGIINSRLKVEGLSINLFKGEVVLWLFNKVELFEIKSRTSYVGGSHGVSIRIAKGLYYRVGAFKGERVQTQDLVRQDVGSLIITNRNVYFSGPMKSLRIRLNKIVSVQGYSDGIALTRESVNPKPLTFMLDDPWFASNLILRLGAI